MELSDSVVGMSKNIQILIGVDYINRFLIHKREEHGEVAWLSIFGWVLSGPIIASEGTGRLKSPFAEKSNDYVFTIFFLCTRKIIDRR